MSQLGERLRHARESQGISLAQAALETRILQQSLESLEEGAFQRLPGDVVTRGFIRNYAQYLHLSPEECIEMYRRERGATDKIRVVPATNPPRTRSYVMPSFFGVFFVTIALVGLSYVALNALGRLGSGATVGLATSATPAIATPTALPTTGPSAPTSTPSLAPTSPLPTPGAATPVPGLAGGTLPTPQPVPTPAAPIVVEVSIQGGTQPSWLRVRTDGVVVYERTMRPDERQIFEASREIYIRAGNPSVVQVSVNGLQQGTIGLSPGKPVDWYWPPR